MLSTNLYALDFGTTKFCIAALRSKPTTQQYYVETISVDAQGMRRGMLADISKASKALNTLLDQAEKQIDEDITKVCIGIAGSHLLSYHNEVVFDLGGKEVTHKEIKALEEKARESFTVPDRELLHAVPVSFRVDQREEVNSPIGFSGSTLTGSFFFIHADRSYVKDVIKLCNQCGLEVTRLYSEPFASASVTLEEVAKQHGVAIADIGGGTTDGIVFKDSKPIGAFTVNIAGKMMTQDLAIGLSLSELEANKVKNHFGLSPRDACDVLQLQKLDGTLFQVAWKEVAPIIIPRVDELGTQLHGCLIEFRGKLAAGLQLTGGGAEMRGLDRYFAKKFKVPVKKALPKLDLGSDKGAIEIKDQIFPTKYATAIGLLNLEVGYQLSQSHIKKGGATKVFNQFFNWLKELT